MPSLRHTPSSVLSSHAPLHSLNTSHPRFFDNLLRFAGQLLDDFGISHNPDFQQKFPTDRYFRTVRMNWEQLSGSEVCDGHEVELKVMLIFDRFQREHLDNAFFSHPLLRASRCEAASLNTVRLVERSHRTLQEMVVKLLAHKSHLGPEFWGLAYLHSVDLMNILPNRNSIKIISYDSVYNRTEASVDIMISQ
jgi:hypothetical protein